MLVVSPTIRIPLEEFRFTFARSGGPGGQNVNKVNSKAVLRWSLMTSPSLPEEVRERFVATFGTRLTNEGEIVIASEESRDQAANKQTCLDKLAELLAAVAKAPKQRRPTKPSYGSKLRRLEDKHRNSERKSGRRPPPD